MAVKGEAPTIESEMAKFSGMTTNNGATVDPKATVTTASPGEVNITDDERQAGAKVINEQGRGTKSETKTASEPVKLTDEEADEALEAAGKELAEGEELTDEEKTEALEVALANKQKAAAKTITDPNQRVKRAQDGRRRAEARAAAAERTSKDLERRLAALETGGKAAPLTNDGKAGNAAVTDKEPDAKDFEFGEVDPKYIRALARFEAKQEIAEASKNQQTQSRTAEQERAQGEFNEKKEALEAAGLDLYDDFQDVVLDTVNLPKSDPAAWPLSETVARLLVESDFGPQIIYGLASDPKEARRVYALTPAKQAAWVGAQEAKHEAKKPAEGSLKGKNAPAERQESSQQPKESSAPIPIKRNSGATGNRTVSSATTDFAAFEAMARQPAKR